VSLQSLAIYFDCDQPLLAPTKKWNLLDAREWDAMLCPSTHDAKLDHQHLLRPVDGTMLYVRRGPAACASESDAAHQVDLKLVSISVGLHQLQYVSGQKLLKVFDEYQIRAPHSFLRPHCRPVTGAIGADSEEDPWVRWADVCETMCADVLKCLPWPMLLYSHVEPKP